MKLEPECIGCLLNQVNKAFKLLRPDISREEIINTQKKVMEYLVEVDTNNSSAPIVGGFIYNLVAEILGVVDPYHSLKDKYNRLALKYYDEIKELISKTKDPLLEAIAVSALGNTIDLGAQHQINLIDDIKKFSPENLIINDYHEFKKSLEKAGQLLILGDNSGEIVFDKLLISIIKEFYPNLQIIYSVRAIPVINDATIEDARFIGLTEIVHVIEASPIPGIDMNRTTVEFKKYFFSNDILILSKGQGNFESLYGMKITSKEVYYLLKAKCNLMERIFGVKIGDFIFKKKTPNF